MTESPAHEIHGIGQPPEKGVNYDATRPMPSRRPQSVTENSRTSANHCETRRAGDRTINRFLTVLGIATVVLVAIPARAQTGPGLDLTWNTIDCGGGVASSGALSLFGTIAQPDAGVMSGGGFELWGGFIGGGGGPPACYADCNLSGTITVADFGCFQTKFVVGDLYADCNQSGTLTVADFGCFQTKFVVGCP